MFYRDYDMWKIGDKALVNSNSYSNFDSNRQRVGTVISVEEPKNLLNRGKVVGTTYSITVEFNDEYTEAILRDPDMKRDILTDNCDAFDKVSSVV